MESKQSNDLREMLSVANSKLQQLDYVFDKLRAKLNYIADLEESDMPLLELVDLAVERYDTALGNCKLELSLQRSYTNDKLATLFEQLEKLYPDDMFVCVESLLPAERDIYTALMAVKGKKPVCFNCRNYPSRICTSRRPTDEEK